MKDCDFQFKNLIFFYIISLDLCTLGPAYLQYQHSFLEMRVWKAVKISLWHSQLPHWTQSTFQKQISSDFGRDKSLRVTNQDDQAN